MLSAISRRNAVLHCAACSNVRGGTKRVLVRPAIDALAITAIPQVGTAVLSISATAVRMTPPCRATRHVILGWCGGVGKSNSCRGARLPIGARAVAALPSRRREREFVQLVPLLTQCEATARAREVTQPSNFARAEAAEISRCRGIAGGGRLDRTLEIR